jgi:hypothetical protein
MKKFLKFLVISIVLAMLVIPTGLALAQDPTPTPGTNYTGDQLVIGNTYRLSSGDTLTGNLAIVGGTATIESGATLSGDTILSGGTLTLSGTLHGDIIAIGGAVTLDDTAVVNGNLVLIGATLKRSPLAVINGEITEQSPSFFNLRDTEKVLSPFNLNNDPLTRALSITFESLAMSALAVILGLILPNQIKRVSATITSQPLIAGGVGLLTIVVLPIILVLLTITIILIPVTILTILLFVFTMLFGWIAAGHEIGDRIESLFHVDWHPAISAGIGVLLLSLVTGFATMIPCAGWLIGGIIALFGLGAVVISRFGSEKYSKKVINAVLPSRENQPSVEEESEKPQ